MRRTIHVDGSRGIEERAGRKGSLKIMASSVYSGSESRKVTRGTVHLMSRICKACYSPYYRNGSGKFGGGPTATVGRGGPRAVAADGSVEREGKENKTSGCPCCDAGPVH